MFFRFRCLALLLPCWLALAGCSPTAENQLDEQKNPFFQEGKRRAGARDYKGAIEAFERAVEINPRSALAHYELGVLYEQRENDYTAAIHHYNKAIKLRPDGSYPADLARVLIPGCKQELVKAESLGAVNPTALRDFEKLREENAQLRKFIDQLQAQLAAALQAAKSVPAPNPPPVGRAPAPSPGAIRGPGTPGATVADAGSRNPAARPAAPARTHLVKAGETPTSIARKHGVTLSSLMTANPGLDPRRMRAGQTLNIPAP